MPYDKLPPVKVGNCYLNADQTEAVFAALRAFMAMLLDPANPIPLVEEEKFFAARLAEVLTYLGDNSHLGKVK
jgi:hypothetical protein